MRVLKCLEFASYGTIVTYGLYRIVCRMLDRDEKPLWHLISGQKHEKKPKPTKILVQSNGNTELDLDGDIVFDAHGRAIGFKPNKDSARRWSQWCQKQMENALEEASSGRGIPVEEVFRKQIP